MTLPFCIDYIDTFISKIVTQYENNHALYSIKIADVDVIILEMVDQNYWLKHFVTRQGQLTLTEALKWFIDKYPDMKFGLLEVDNNHILIGFDMKNFNTSAKIKVSLYYVYHGRANILTFIRNSKTIKNIISIEIGNLLLNVDDPLSEVYQDFSRYT
uniref:Uncharacterized protein n=1 Tax=Pithovirus LCPAC406 TaxID=2506599 RepID=A0A481ZGL3_9VIRU|nr:MAG: hypothetical protein LCPAC406_02840 [Pithovirus LCPAC406]